ncbi:baseplate assembly protein [Asticcacaulis taihuensis]|uniref:baseplate assembly protein n=1 Tax=Asticcacaulis taihuensis TaxID=260084 RepID=UPI0026F20C9C|nr:baseplate J/gp47 family protein [Asticcacaulis taihuensis]
MPRNTSGEGRRVAIIAHNGRMTDASTFTAIDLSRLPAPSVIDSLDFETIYADLLAELKTYIPAFDDRIESDPAVILLQMFARRMLTYLQRQNDAAKKLLLAYAIGADLDHIGVTYYNAARLLITPADPDNDIPEDIYESDDDYRRRLSLAPEGYSVAGPAGAYIFHALSADADVADASVTSPAPKEVLVTILSRSNGGVASAELIAKVQDVLSADTVRPLTDEVTVQAAEIVDYAVVASVATYSGPDPALVVAKGEANAQALSVRLNRLGLDVKRAAYIAAIHSEGAQNTVLTSPATDIPISSAQASRCTSVTVTHSGVDE